MTKEPIMIRDVPKDERPRERLINDGASALSNQELIAILLRTGTAKESVLQIAQRLLKRFDGLRMLQDASIEELMEIRGIGMAKAIQILAAVELSKRIGRLNPVDRYTIRSPEDGANFVMEEMRFLSQEHFVCVYLNVKNQVMHKQTIFIGSLSSSIVHPREVVRP